MDNITKEYIEQHAPDMATVKNAISLCNKNSFIMQSKTENEDLFFAECKGSGKKNYKVSADFSSPNKPIFRCNCPSRKLPCKHSIGLLQDILNGSSYAVAEIPEDILLKREKAVKRQEKKIEEANNPKPKKVNKSAKLKKIKKQLEGLEIAEKLVSDILDKGISTIDLQSTSIYTDIAKEMGNYYLTGLQGYIYELIDCIDDIKVLKKHKADIDYSKTIQVLIKFNSLINKSKAHLEECVEKEIFQDESELFESLGGVWKLEELNALGFKKDKPNLLQIGFYVKDSKFEKKYIDVGYFCDLESGAINPTYNYRPYKATKFIKEEDIIFDVVEPSVLTYYPGEVNQRIRFNDYTLIEFKKDHALKVKSFGKDIESSVRQAKNYLKNTLSKDRFPALISYTHLGINAQDDVVLRDSSNNELIIIEENKSVSRNIRNLPNKDLYKNQAIFGEIVYDEGNKLICLSPLSIIGDDVIYL